MQSKFITPLTENLNISLISLKPSKCYKMGMTFGLCAYGRRLCVRVFVCMCGWLRAWGRREREQQSGKIKSPAQAASGSLLRLSMRNLSFLLINCIIQPHQLLSVVKNGPRSFILTHIECTPSLPTFTTIWSWLEGKRSCLAVSADTGQINAAL